jgi:subtilisin family serine protease
MITITRGSIPGRIVGDVEIDKANCDPVIITKTIESPFTSQKPSYNLKSGGFTPDVGPIKKNVYLCGDGAAVEQQVLLSGSKAALAGAGDSLGLSLIRHVIPAGAGLLPGDQGIDLFNIISKEFTVSQKVKQINDTHPNGLTATPNYETTSRPTPSIGGSPSDVPGRNDKHEADFKSQWGFDRTKQAAAAASGFTGKGVNVVIFDAYCGNGSITPNEAQVMKVTSDIQITGKAEPSTLPDVCDHGEVVWSISQAVAPDASYFLYPVLDNHGLGDMSTLIDALNDLLTLGGAQPNRPLQGTIINLSLGINMSQGDLAGPLQLVLQQASDQGAFIVAAAGNDSELGIEPMQLPAAYTFVMAVGATNSKLERADYSNWVVRNNGDVAAPGGNFDCTQLPTECVIGRDRGHGGDYVSWKGTSFAAPLVSGLAALVMQKSGKTSSGYIRAAILNRTQYGTAVINCNFAGTSCAGTGLGDGLVNIDDTLNQPFP